MVQNGVVIVTGCAGFIGSHVSEALLKEGTTVIGIDILSDYYDLKIKHENLRILRATSRKSRGTPGAEGNGEFIFYEADICNRKEMDKIFQKAKKLGGAQEGIKVCHLAARAGVRPSLENPEGYVQTNVEGTVILLDLARIHQAKNFVYASSSSVYGANQKVPFSEKDPVDSPVSPYAATKRACELMASTFHTLYNLPVTGLRFFTVYGPRGRPDMAPFKFVHRISNGLPIDRFGDGTSARDYTFIDDIVSGVLGAIHNPQPCEVINLGNSQVISLNEFISVIETCVGKKAIIRQLPEQPGDVPLTYADCEKASRLLGYKPSNSIRQGMEKFVKWYNEFNSTTPSDQPSQKTAKPLIKRPTIAGDEIESPSSDLEISSEDFD